MKKDHQRLEKLRIFLKEADLDAALLFHPENVLLASGIFSKAPFTVCLVTVTGDIYIICPWWTSDHYACQNYINEIKTFNWLKSLEAVDPAVEILEAVKNIAFDNGITKIGIDRDWECIMPASTPSSTYTYQNLKSNLNKIDFLQVEDISQGLHVLRAIKTEYEIEMLKKANIVASKAAKAFYENALPGKTELDIASEVSKAVILAAGKDEITFTYCDPPQITSGPERTLYAYALTCLSTNRKLKKGDLVMLELGGCADGYWFDLTRTLVAGDQPEPIHLDMAWAINNVCEVVYKAYCSGCADAGQLAEIGIKAFGESDFKDGIVHGLGHGVGFSYHENLPVIGLGSTDEIKPNMVTSMEPGIYLKDIGGMRIEQNIHWKENSVSILSDYHNNITFWKD